MAVLAIVTGNGITKKTYEALRPEVKWETNHPAGALLHACGFDEKGNLHVADVWESAEALKAFVEGRLAPALKKLGAPQPTVTIFPAHNINLFPAAQKYQLKQPAGAR